MPPNLAMVDIPALARLSWDLYHSCYLISGDAPDGFRNLVTELASLQGTLGAFRDHVTSNPSFFESLPEDRIHGLRSCLHGSHSALKQLGDLVTKYRGSGLGDGPNFEWDTHRGQIEGLRSRIMVYSANLHLYMTPTSNSSPKGLESLILDALATTPSQEPQDEPEPEVKPPGSGIQTMSTECLGLDAASELDAPSSVKPDTIVQLESPPGIHPSNSTSSDSRLSEYSSGSISTAFTNKTLPISPLRTSLSSPTPPERHLIGRSPVSSGSRASEGLYQDYPRSQGSESLSEKHGSAPYGSSINPPITPTSAGTLRQLHELQLRDQHLRPLRYEPRDTIHQPDPTILEKFELSSNYEDHCQSLSTRDWLRIAVWWQLKARANLANGERPSLVSPRGSTSPSTKSSNSGHQAYVDLLKASYILYDIVLKRLSPQSLVIDENRKLIADLSDSIKEDFSQFISVDIPDPTTISLHNLDIWEAVQPDESSYSSEENLLSLENVRYTAVELEDAGAEDERVILRAFVNAGIGGKKLRMRTKTAPYMLLLSTVQGESEPKITVCNQSGTLCLQRDFTADDLAQLIKVSNATLGGIPGAKISEPVTLNFGTIPVSISFQYSSDLGQFINIPKAYFDSVWQREPADSEQFSESVIFKSSVDIVEQLRAPIMKSMNPPLITRSCQVQVLERTFGEVWRSIRRMVISSSMAEKAPTSLEFFMPMCGVQVHRNEMSQSVQIKWSDTGQERSDKTDGSYNPVYSYVYDENSPNIGLDIQFRSHERAAEFERAILSLTQTPSYSWAQPSSSGSVYDLADVSLEQKQYKAILRLENRLSFRYCSLYYLYRDIDYIYDSSSMHVKFPKIFYVDYISSHVEQLYRATSNMQVFFSHCEKKTGNMEMFFTDESVSHSFMSSLASGYGLCFSRRAESMTTKKQSFLGSNKSTKGETEVQLWRKGNSIQLAARWTNNVPDRWLSMSIPSGSCRSISSRDGNRVEFPVTAYTRGSILNLAVIASGSPKDARMAKKSGPITIYFQQSKDRDDFIAALDGSAQSNSAWKYGHGYDLLGS